MFINYIHKGYSEVRNFLYSKLSYKQSYDIFKLYSHFSFKLFKHIPQWALNLFYQPFKTKNSIIHFFNGINFGEQKWITTFETSLPRIGNVSSLFTHWAVKRMVKGNCTKLLALSECTYNIQRKFLIENFPDYAKHILNKTEVLHPPQEILLRDYNFKPDASHTVIFTFVGNEFFRKGGREILEIFLKLHGEGYRFLLNVVSNFSSDTYASKTSQKDVEAIKNKIKYLPPCIKIRGSLPNTAVIKLFQQSHVGLLPTYADTYGYSVLEAQSCGCPVITTDIRALPEINNEECGWVIPVPKDENGNGLLGSDQDRLVFSDLVKNGLFENVKNILEHPETIKAKGLASLERIKKYHNPRQHAQKLHQIYLEAIDDV